MRIAFTQFALSFLLLSSWTGMAQLTSIKVALIAAKDDHVQMQMQMVIEALAQSIEKA